MNLKKTSDVTKCSQEQCVHFIEKGKQHFYRKHFLWITVSFSLLCVAVLGYLIYYHNTQMDKIIKQHEIVSTAQAELIKNVKIGKGVAQIDESILRGVDSQIKTIEDLLALQANNQHAQYTLLSIWAGVLMIVFLVFSLYSMFKTDELIKQARESLNTIGNSKVDVDNKILEVDEKIEEAVGHIKEESLKSLDEIKRNLQIEQNKVSVEIKSKGEDISNKLNEYQKKLDSYQSTVEGVYDGIKIVLDAVNKTGMSSTKNETINTK